MKSKGLIRKERIIEYFDNIERQIKDIRSIPIPGKDFFLNRENSIQIKAIKYSLACAIQDVTHISAHIASTLSLWKVRESEAEAILGGSPITNSTNYLFEIETILPLTSSVWAMMPLRDSMRPR